MVDLASKKPEHHPGGENFDFEAYWKENTEEHMSTAKETFANVLPEIVKWVKVSEEASN